MAKFKMYSNTNTLKLVFICIRIRIQYWKTPYLDTYDPVAITRRGVWGASISRICKAKLEKR